MLLTIDIGGTFIKYGLMDQNDHLVHTDKIPTPPTIEEFWQGLESKRPLALFFEAVSSPICETFPWLVG